MADDAPAFPEVATQGGAPPSGGLATKSDAYHVAEAVLGQMSRAAASASLGLERQAGAPAVEVEAGARLPSAVVRYAAARYQALVEQIPAITFMATLDGSSNELYVSPQIESMLGFTQKEWLENPVLWYTQLHPDDRERWHTEFALSCASGTPFRAEYRFVSRDGRIVWVHGEAKVVRDGEGRPLFLHGTAFDVTKHKEAEETLRRAQEVLEEKVRERTAELSLTNQALREQILEREQAEARIRDQATLLNKATDAILVHDLRGRISFWNRSAAQLYGWTEQEVLGRDVDEILPLAGSSEIEEAWRSLNEKGEWSGELHQSVRDGRKIIVASRWTRVLDDQGNPKAVLIINSNITAQKELQTLFYRAQRMESIGTLAGGIAHDLNNLLTPLLVSVQLLKMPLPEVRRDAILEMIQANVERGAEIVRQVLMFARGGEGERVPVPLGALIQDVKTLLSSTIPKSVTIATAIRDSLWIVLGEANKIHQVLVNLCVNACDAMPDGGVLNISAENIVLDESAARLHNDVAPGTYVVVTVEDRGTGIPAEILDKIFDPFFTTKELGKGTGLGLSTVLGIVQGHRGFVTVSTVLGKGSRFAVYLPATQATAAGQRDEGAVAPAPGGGASFRSRPDLPDTC